MVLKFLVFAAFAFVLFEATVGLGEHELGSGRVGVIIAGMAGLLFLLAIDRLTTLRFSASGVEATLAEAKAHAMEAVGALDNPEVAETVRVQILQAKSADCAIGPNRTIRCRPITSPSWT